MYANTLDQIISPRQLQVVVVVSLFIHDQRGDDDMQLEADDVPAQPPDSTGPANSSKPQLRLLDQVRARIRYKHYSYRTEKVYLGWIRQYIRYHGLRHPRTMGAPEVEQYLSALANERDVAASTQNQALSALLFLYVSTSVEF